MKVKFEVDITPEEVKELFEGNMDVFQRFIIESFMKSQSKKMDQNVMAFWQTMADKSKEFFDQYQHGVSPDNKN